MDINVVSSAAVAAWVGVRLRRPIRVWASANWRQTQAVEPAVEAHDRQAHVCRRET